MKKKVLPGITLTVLACSVLFLSGCENRDTETLQADDKYIVTFNPSDRDQELIQAEVEPGKKMEEPQTPVREDYEFTGWYADKRCKGEVFDFSTEITGDLFLYAGWASTKVQVTFEPGYEGAETQMADVDYGSAIAEEQIPEAGERENYEFTGWYTDSGRTEIFDFSNTMTKNLKLYAGWKQVAATVTFDIGYEGAEEIPAQMIELTDSAKAEEPPVPKRGETGDYQFEGWYVGEGKKEMLYDFDSVVTGDLTLHGKWTVLQATLTYDMNCEDAEDYKEKVKLGNSPRLYEKAEREGFDFAGWYFDEACTSEADVKNLVLEEDLTVYAAWKAQPRTVVFDYNYKDGPEDKTVEALYGTSVKEPEDPERDGYEFTGWYKDKREKEAYSFGEGLTEDMTLYAGWERAEKESDTKDAEKESGEANADSGAADKKGKTNTLTFYVNDGTDAVYMTEEVKRNKSSSMRNSGATYPEREGYKAVGWYTTPECEDGTEFDVNGRVRESMDLYAKWMKETIFEAELTQLTDIPIGDTGKTEDKLGFGESSNPKGLYLIEWDNYNAGASNDYYVSYLYNPGSYLEFCITAEEDVTDAALVLRLSPELHDMYFGTGGPDGTAAEKDGYKIYVNPVYSFNSVSNTETLESFDQEFVLQEDLTGAVTKDEDPNYTQKRAFEDYTITTSLNLHQGENIIRLVTDNTHDYGGSMHAAAPMVDCMKIYTDAELGWTEGKEYQSNLDGIDVRWPDKKN